MKRTKKMKNHIIPKFAFSFILLLSGFSLLFISSCNDESSEVDNSTKMSMKTLPKVHYVLGEALDLSDMVVVVGQGSSAKEVPYASFGSEGIVCEPDNGTILNFENESFIIRSTNSGRGITQSIDVTNNIASMVVKTAPVTDYFTGELLDLSALVIEATLENGNKEDISFDEFGESFMVMPANGSVLSTDVSEVMITHIATEVSTSIAVSVVDFVPTSAMVVSGPTKNSYEIGERLDLEGLVVKYETTAGITKEIAAADFAIYGITTVPANEERVGASNGTIPVLHGSGIDTSFDIEVIPLNVTGMSILFKPDKTLYVDGELMDHSGMVITLTIDGASNIDVAAADFGIYGIVAVPEHGVAWDASMTEIVISYPGYAETVSITLGSEILYESNFAADGTAGWSVNQNGGGSVNLLVENGNLVAKDIVKGTNTWDVQLYYPGLTIENGAKYKYTIIIKKQDPSIADYWLNLSLGDGDGRHGWGPYDGGNGVWFGGDGWQTVEREFVMTNETTDAARLLFEIGNDGYGIVIQYVKIEKLS
jgi:hypothetical protein